MSKGSRWKVQSTWRVDDDPRSYAPVFVNTESEAHRIAAGMRSTLSHFVDLEVSVQEVDAHTAADEQAAVDARCESGDQRTIHLLSGSNLGAACGAPIDTFNSTLSGGLWPLSSGNKCALCHAMLSSP